MQSKCIVVISSCRYWHWPWLGWRPGVYVDYIHAFIESDSWNMNMIYALPHRDRICVNSKKRKGKRKRRTDRPTQPMRQASRLLEFEFVLYLRHCKGCTDSKNIWLHSLISGISESYTSLPRQCRKNREYQKNAIKPWKVVKRARRQQEGKRDEVRWGGVGEVEWVWGFEWRGKEKEKEKEGPRSKYLY